MSNDTANDHAKLPRIAYLTGQYPLVSLTFIQREIAALRALGVDVETVSIRQTPPEQHLGPAEKDAAASTHYLLREVRRPIAVLAAQIGALRRPRRYLRALRLALKLRGPGLKSLAYQLIYFLEATLMAHHVTRRDISHIHSHFVTNGTTVAMLTAELTGVPFSFTLHGPADLFEPYRWRLDEKTARASFVATISHYARSQLMFFSAPEHWHKIRIIHCGVQPQLYRNPAPLPPREEIRLIFVGRLAPVKGIRILFDAVSQLAPRLPNLRLTIVGDGPDRAGLERAAQELGERVRFTGYLSQSDVAEALGAHDICVLPSFAEGVPVILMEALASGRPVIATQVAGIGDLVTHGVHGLLAPPGDTATLMAHIETLARDGTLRDAMGAEGRRKVKSDFNVDTEARRLLALFTDPTSQNAIRPKPFTRSIGGQSGAPEN